MTKWESWYETPEGKEYYKKYLSDIAFINDDKSIKNAYYEYVENIYKKEDSIKNFVGSTFSKFIIFTTLAIGAYIYLKTKK